MDRRGERADSGEPPAARCTRGYLDPDPVCAGVNTEQIEDIGRFLTQLPRVRRVEILPYHTLGAEKSAELNRVQRQFPVPDAAACETAEQTLRMLGLPVTSGRAQKKGDKK